MPRGIHPRKIVKAEERFWRKVNKTSACWFWFGGGGRYGAFRVTQKLTKLPHRFAYELLRGPVQAGLVLDHLCHHPRCVNPEHLQPVTQAENNKRAISMSKTMIQCKRGHPFNLFNTYFDPTGRRQCRSCRAARQHQYAQEAISQVISR